MPHKIDFFFKCLIIQLDENPEILRQVGDEISKIPAGLFTPLENQVSTTKIMLAVKIFIYSNAFSLRKEVP